MELDKRFKVLPFCCFNRRTVINYIGKKGYFANQICYFQDIKLCKYGTLGTFLGDQQESFYMNETDETFSFFMPECFVKPKEKQYRAFKDTNEFFIKTNFEEGDLIHIRSKDKIEFWVMLVGWLNNGIMLGTENFTFDKLFDKFELWNGEDKFIPFGVEVEE